MTVISSMSWRRIDVPGRDAGRLEQIGEGWRLEGAAVFRGTGGVTALAYSVQCDAQWRTIAGQVRGFIGDRAVEADIVRRSSVWTLNGVAVAGLDHLLDLDLSFTPATNLHQLRRVPMAVGESTPLPVAWFDVDAGTLSELLQIYERRSPDALWYRAPSVGYQGLLELASNGFIRSYPDLWIADTPSR
jgi:uncharacterized protein